MFSQLKEVQTHIQAESFAKLPLNHSKLHIFLENSILTVSLIFLDGFLPLILVKVPQCDGKAGAVGRLYFMWIPSVRPEKYNSIKERFYVDYLGQILGKYPEKIDRNQILSKLNPTFKSNYLNNPPSCLTVQFKLRQ